MYIKVYTKHLSLFCLESRQSFTCTIYKNNFGLTRTVCPQHITCSKQLDGN